MKTGLVMGKFMPFHKGHEALIDYALEFVDKLLILVVSKEGETIPLETRIEWLKSHYKEKNVQVNPFIHNLPHDGTFTKEHMDMWCQAVEAACPQIDVFISSEAHGDYLADYMGIEHLTFEPKRESVPVSASVIRDNPEKYADYLVDEVKAYYGLK